MAKTENRSGGDVVVIGAGLAGAFAVLRLKGRKVTWIATRSTGESGSSAFAQGGIAAALGDDDYPELHLDDTLKAGAGLVDEAAARVLVEEGPALVRELAALGVPFDRDASGALALGREAAHVRRRVIHAGGDRTGALIMKTLAPMAAAQDGVTVISNAVAENLILTDGGVAGVALRHQQQAIAVTAPHVLLATGGIGALYEATTNPPDSCGEGLGMAARAGALVADPEFVQFHPTALAVGRDPAPLASEALRGEGAWLINQTGARFCFDHHKDGELAPRDVVARAIYAELRAGNVVYLDTRAALGDTIESRFPTIFASAMAAGIDPRSRPIPVRPAAHYHMGGIAVTVDGASSLPGLWAAGEVAATGVHGANRLASNSLLDALVTAARAATAIAGSERVNAAPAPIQDRQGPFDPKWQTRLRHVMSQYAGGLRDAAGLNAGLDQLSALEAGVHGHQPFANRLAAAQLVLTAALNRRESRGAHARADFPDTAPAAERSFLSLSDCRPKLRRHAGR